ncbi:MAG: transcriptional regulator [Rhizobiaceae bacterium]
MIKAIKSYFTAPTIVVMLAFFSLSGFQTGQSHAAELIMLEQEYCAWCERWKKEIGPIYPKTTESKIAPLRVINIHDPLPEDLKDLSKGRFTPTFVLMHEGKEIGRMRGYTSEDFFWGLLDEMLKKLPAEAQTQS